MQLATLYFIVKQTLRHTMNIWFYDKKKNRKSAIKGSSLQFYGVIILVKTKPLCRGMAWLPFQKDIPKVKIILPRQMLKITHYK